MFTYIDSLLDKITMYRLTLYLLLFLIGSAVVLSFFHVLSYTPLGILISTTILISACWISNKAIGYLLNAPTNVESAYITACILTLIMTPAKSMNDAILLTLVGFVAMISKYIFAIGKKHLFNPAALAAVTSGFIFQQYVSWWVGTESMLPFVIITGFLLTRKIQRWSLVTSVLLIAAVSTVGFGLIYGINPSRAISALFLDSAIVFFATIMATEPLTTPPTKYLQIVYGAIVGFLFTPQIHIGDIYATPELSLVVGNIFSYFVSPKQKLFLQLATKKHVGEDEIAFAFQSPAQPAFSAGQYMEWTLKHSLTDARGNRRYFTIASSPTEDGIQLGSKFYPNGSSFKRALQNLDVGSTIIASQLAGEFILPKDRKKKLVFLAGGIGITPFRSMVKFLSDNEEKRDIILVYSNKKASEIMYKDVFDEGEQNIGLKMIYTLTDVDHIPKNWKGEKGRVSREMVQKKIPDYIDRFFYLSGPRSMVLAFEGLLHEMHIPQKQIKKDFFPGFV